MSVVTGTIKPKIDALLRGHGPGDNGFAKNSQKVKNEIFCYYYCIYYYSTRVLINPIRARDGNGTMGFDKNYIHVRIGWSERYEL